MAGAASEVVVGSLFDGNGSSFSLSCAVEVNESFVASSATLISLCSSYGGGLSSPIWLDVGVNSSGGGLWVIRRIVVDFALAGMVVLGIKIERETGLLYSMAMADVFARKLWHSLGNVS